MSNKIILIKIDKIYLSLACQPFNNTSTMVSYPFYLFIRRKLTLLWNVLVVLFQKVLRKIKMLTATYTTKLQLLSVYI